METNQTHEPWNKGKLVGQKPPLKPKEVWAIRVRLQLQGKRRDLALFNLAVNSKLRSCDLVALPVVDGEGRVSLRWHWRNLPAVIGVRR